MADGFLDALSPDELAHLHARGVVRRFPRGTALFHERQVSDRVMMLTHGRVKIAPVSDDGRESVLAFRGPGEVLGELSTIDGRPRSAGVTAVRCTPGAACTGSRPSAARSRCSTWTLCASARDRRAKPG